MVNVTSSDLLSASAVISLDDCYLAGFDIITDGISNAELTIYDGFSETSDSAILKRIVTSTNYFNNNTFLFPIHCKQGISTVFVGTNCRYVIYYIDNKSFIQYISIFTITMQDGTIIQTQNGNDIVMQHQ